jgi:hypothetical protein
MSDALLTRSRHPQKLFPDDSGLPRVTGAKRPAAAKGGAGGGSAEAHAAGSGDSRCASAPAVFTCHPGLLSNQPTPSTLNANPHRTVRMQ